MVLTPQVDIHCHLLPDWDDGPHTLSEALNMASGAWASGLRTVLITPHVDRHDISRPERPSCEIAAATSQLQREVRAAGIDLNLLPGAEVTLSPGLPARLADEPWLSLGGLGRHILIELSPGMPWTAEVDDLLFQIALQGLTPILAHPERYVDVQKDIALARRAVERGSLLQLTARSLVRSQGATAQTARALMQAGLVSFVASDAHAPALASDQAPEHVMVQAAPLVSFLLGEEGARRLLIENPQSLLEGHAIGPVPASAGGELGASSRPSLLRKLFSFGRFR